jgi:beta-mannosidase
MLLGTAVLVLLFAAASTGARSTATSLELGNLNWTLSARGNSSFTAIPATVPGDVYTALEAASLIADPYQGENLHLMRWVALSDWDYDATIPAQTVGDLCNDAIATAAGVMLHIAGLEAVAEVWVAGQKVATTVTLHLPINADIADALCGQAMEGFAAPVPIKFRFNSSLNFAAAQEAAYKAATNSTPDAPAIIGGFPHRNFIRSTQSSFGWDWGPAVAASSIRGPATIRVVATCQPTEIILSPRLVSCRDMQPATAWQQGETNNFTVTVNASFLLPRGCVATGANITIDVRDEKAVVPVTPDGSSTSWLSSQDPRQAAPRRGWVVITVRVSNVSLWWPRGYGAAPLYNLSATVATVGNDGFTISAARATVTSFGFRCVALVTNATDLPIPNVNSSVSVMAFLVNGVPVFAKGANVIPPEMLYGRSAFEQSFDARLLSVIRNAVQANMNILRIWGGGQYLPSVFYEECDRQGMMVWQEAMFACSEYPIDGAFLNAVHDELAYQITRLARHSSIVLWSGNNEDGMVYDHGPTSAYQRLNTDVVLATIVAHDDSRPVWPSSPSPGFESGTLWSGLPSGTVDQPVALVTLPPQEGTPNGTHGDAHFYNYSACVSGDLDVFPITAFASEFGYEGLPYFAEMQASMGDPSKDRGMFTDFMNYRQHHPDGNSQMWALMQGSVPIPPTLAANIELPLSAADFETLSWLSQIQQANCMKAETAFYRRGAARTIQPTMGTMYWQLNIVWSSPSWTSVDYSGTYRILHFVMATAFHPHAIHTRLVPSTIVSGATALTVYVSNDQITATSFCLYIEHIATDGSADHRPILQKCGLLANAYTGLELGEVIPNVTKSLGALHGILRVRTHPDSSASSAVMIGNPDAEYVMFPSLKEVGPLLQLSVRCAVEVDVVAIDVAVLKVSCNGTSVATTLVAAWEQLPRGNFERNGFVVPANETVALSYFAMPGQPPLPDKEQIAASISVWNLNGALSA